MKLEDRVESKRKKDFKVAIAVLTSSLLGTILLAGYLYTHDSNNGYETSIIPSVCFNDQYHQDKRCYNITIE